MPAHSRKTIGGPARLAAGLSALLLIAACDEAGSETAPRIQDIPPPVVRTIEAVPADAEISRYTGVVRSRVESGLGFRVPGLVIDRRVDPGDEVRKGEVLMRLDASDYALRHEAALASARAAEKEIAAARAEVVRLKGDEDRYRRLLDSGHISRQLYDQTAAAYRQASARLASAEAQLAAANAAARESGNQQAYATLKADADGVVMDVGAEVGQVVQAGQAVVTLAHSGQREAVVPIPETRIGNVPERATARLLRQPGKPIGATLRELSAAADPMTRTYEARYQLERIDRQPPLGSTITIEVAEPAPEGVEVPLGALFDQGDGPGVWIVDPEALTVAFHPVEVVTLGDETVRIGNAGLAPDDRIVALGANLLTEGETVRLEPGVAP